MKKIAQERFSLVAEAVYAIGGSTLLEEVILKFLGLPPAFVATAIFVKPVNEDWLMKVPFADIYWIEADRSYTHIHLHDNRYVSVTGNIGKLEEFLPKRLFVRVSRSEIVNIHKVEKIMGNTLYIGGHKATVTKNHRKSVFECIIMFR